MDNIGKSIKSFGLKFAKAVENAASSVAASANKKVDKINLESRRHEIMSGFGTKCYEMWKAGTKFPDEIETLFTELAEIDEQLKAFVPVATDNQEAAENHEAVVEEAAEACEIEEVAEAVEEASEGTADAEQCPEAIETSEETEPCAPVIKVEEEKE